MLAIATTDDEIDALTPHLERVGARLVEVLATGETRRVAIARLDDDTRAAAAAASLRDAGLLAASRPSGGSLLAAWHRDNRAAVFGDHLAVCRAWSEENRAGLPPHIELGPGGFGNGHHPTTALIINELIDRVRGGEDVLDVGCGSGVLGLCALHLGADQLVGVDLEQASVDATRNNGTLNGYGGRVAAHGSSPSELARSFDIVLANIAREGIVALATELVAATGPGGWLAVSGITPWQCDQVAGFLEPLVDIDRRSMGDWAVLVLRNAGA